MDWNTPINISPFLQFLVTMLFLYGAFLYGRAYERHNRNVQADGLGCTCGVKSGDPHLYGCPLFVRKYALR